jgi:glycosyltransferase involved in cell wall biosynthesis
MSDYVEHGVTGLLVPPGDPQRLAVAVEQLLREPERARALGSRAAEVTRRDFSTTAMTGRLAELMERML